MKFQWNPILYDEKHDFVFKYGQDIVELLNPKQNETILDLGCGTADLTKLISNSCKKVIGIDNSLDMVNTAKDKYPEISFYHMDAVDFILEDRFDAVFSNAVLHWVTDVENSIKNINKHLKVGGRFVAEFGGNGCNSKIINALSAILDENSVIHPNTDKLLYFPSIADYSGLLEQNGFEVNFALLFDRPTELKGGLDGLKNFIEMFFNWQFDNVSNSDKTKYIALLEKKLKKELLKESVWVADYRRIRIVAKKNSNYV